MMREGRKERDWCGYLFWLMQEFILVVGREMLSSLSSFLPIISLNHLSSLFSHTLLYSSRRPLDDDLFQVSMIIPLFLSLLVLSRDFLEECVKESALSLSFSHLKMMMMMRRDTVSNPCLFPFSPFLSFSFPFTNNNNLYLTKIRVEHHYKEIHKPLTYAKKAY